MTRSNERVWLAEITDPETWVNILTEELKRKNLSKDERKKIKIKLKELEKENKKIGEKKKKKGK